MANHYDAPVKDCKEGIPDPVGGGGGFEQRAAQERRMVNKWQRDELEDKYLHLYEENILLKKHCRKQEEKLKRLATKIRQLGADKKKEVGEKRGKMGHGMNRDERLDELKNKIYELEKQNSNLKEKLMLTKQQLALSGRRPSTYNHIQARINTGISKPPTDPRLARNMRVIGPQAIGQSPVLSRLEHNFLEEAKAENKCLGEVISQLEEQIQAYKTENANLREQNQIKRSEFEEDLVKVKQQITAEQRVNLHENVELIRLEREVKEKSGQLSELLGKYSSLEENLYSMKRSHDSVLMEMEKLNMQLKSEQNKVLSLEKELKAVRAKDAKLMQMQEQITDLQKDNYILKEANERLTASAFDMDRERGWRQKENSLKVQIAQLEATLKADLGEKGSVLDRLNREMGDREELQKRYQEIQLTHLELQEKYDDLKEKMKFFTKETNQNMEELEEALLLVKQKQQAKSGGPPDFLQRVDEEIDKDLNKRFTGLQADYAETVHELEKTRNMLVMQHKINKDYQQEVEMVHLRIEETKREYDAKLMEYASLLDIRAVRIKKLETQLRDVAYGTKQFKVKPLSEEDDTIGLDENIQLERGQNIFEIHMHQVNLTPEARKQLGDDEPALFCTWEFFEFEIQSTPVIRAISPEFDFTSQYVVTVDDFFLHYLQKESCTVELQQSFGQNYKTLAACQLLFKEIFDRPHGRLHGTASFTGINPNNTGIGYGILEYWVRLRVPIEQALRLYKERTKALGYITANDRSTNLALQALDDVAAKRPADNINELHVKIVRCTGLNARRPNMQPSPYCIYQFLDFDDHDTIIIPSTNNPEFNDHLTFPVPMTVQLDQYLRTMSLVIYVFDDTDPDETEYLSMASIPLISLTSDTPIRGLFELRKKDDSVNGRIEVQLQWQYSYLPPAIAGKTAVQPPSALIEPPEKLSAMQTEEPQSTAERSQPPTQEAHRPAQHIELLASTPTQNSRPVVVTPPGLSAVKQTPQQNGTSCSRIQIVEKCTVEQMSTKTPFAEVPPTTTSSARNLFQDAQIPPTTATVSTKPQPDSQEADAEKILMNQQEKFKDEDSIGEEIATEEDDDDDEIRTSDSEGIVAPVIKPGRQKDLNLEGNVVTVVISHLTLDPNSSLAQNNSVKQLFVAYRFLDDQHEQETPFSLPKPSTGQPIVFNFSKTFNVDIEENYEKRQYLASMLLPDDPDQGRLSFNVVSEPLEDEEEADCEDVGVAFVSIRDILYKNKDIQDEDIPIVEVADKTTVIGTINLSVQCLGALKAVEQEMQVVS